MQDGHEFGTVRWSLGNAAKPKFTGIKYEQKLRDCRPGVYFIAFIEPHSSSLLVSHCALPCPTYKCKNISIKMLNDVGMTVPKSRETRAVYIQQYRG